MSKTVKFGDPPVKIELVGDALARIERFMKIHGFKSLDETVEFLLHEAFLALESDPGGKATANDSTTEGR